jgi:RNA polymerase sigma-70 factor (ECF subfamily)
VDDNFLTVDAFEAERPRLRAIAYRMLGSLAEAEDAVQEAWLRVDRADMAGVDSIPAWLTTVVSRICLNVLRSRTARREQSLESFTADWLGVVDGGLVPEAEAELADSVGLALLVVLDTLSPAERIAFVLHDMFGVAFDDIAPMMERNAASVRQLASRARRRVKSPPDDGDAKDPVRRDRAVSAYLAATRTGDFEALLVLLDPDVVLSADGAVMVGAPALTLQGALTVARAAVAAVDRARHTVAVGVDGTPGLVMAPLGHLCLAIRFRFTGSLISSIDVIGEPERPQALEIASA